MERQKFKKFIPLIILGIFFLAWGYILSNISPQEIVDRLGVTNGYVAVFIITAVAGTSTFLTIPYQLIVMTLAAGGLEPIFLGICAGTGLMFGDTTSYLIGYSGRSLLPSRIEQFIRRIYNWLMEKPEPVTYVALFFYGAAVPIPNDFVVIPMGFMRYPYVKLVIPLVLGNIVSNTVLAYIGLYAADWFIGR